MEGSPVSRGVAGAVETALDAAFGTGRPPEPRCVDIAEAARLLGVGRSTTFRLVADGELASFTVGRRRLIPVYAIDAFIAQRLGAT
jgi:excisionase family DNA binding protein